MSPRHAAVCLHSFAGTAVTASSSMIVGPHVCPSRATVYCGPITHATCLAFPGLYADADAGLAHTDLVCEWADLVDMPLTYVAGSGNTSGTSLSRSFSSIGATGQSRTSCRSNWQLAVPLQGHHLHPPNPQPVLFNRFLACTPPSAQTPAGHLLPGMSAASAQHQPHLMSGWHPCSSSSSRPHHTGEIRYHG